MQIKLISLTIVEHQYSLSNRDKQQLRNGPLTYSQLIGQLVEHRTWSQSSHGIFQALISDIGLTIA